MFVPTCRIAPSLVSPLPLLDQDRNLESPPRPSRLQTTSLSLNNLLPDLLVGDFLIARAGVRFFQIRLERSYVTTGTGVLQSDAWKCWNSDLDQDWKQVWESTVVWLGLSLVHITLFFLPSLMRFCWLFRILPSYKFIGTCIAPSPHSAWSRLCCRSEAFHMKDFSC